VNMIINFSIPQNIWKFLSSCTTGGFSKRAQLHEVSLGNGTEIFIYLLS
jgi:hypothetical protein